MHIKFWLENLKEGDSSGGVGVNGRTTLKNLTEVGWCCADWINVAHGSDLWAVVKTVDNLRVS
jgi:hypothetical protein